MCDKFIKLTGKLCHKKMVFDDVFGFEISYIFLSRESFIRDSRVPFRERVFFRESGLFSKNVFIRDSPVFFEREFYLRQSSLFSREFFSRDSR